MFWQLTLCFFDSQSIPRTHLFSDKKQYKTKKKNPTFVLLGLMLVMATAAFGQKVSYRDIKKDFSNQRYFDSIAHYKYSPQKAALFNYLLPGMGYFYIDEPFRGSCVLGGQIIATGMVVYGVWSLWPNYDNAKKSKHLIVFGTLLFSALRLFSAHDVIKIAMVKNLYYAQQKPVTLKVQPDIQLNPFPDNNPRANLGVKLQIGF